MGLTERAGESRMGVVPVRTVAQAIAIRGTLPEDNLTPRLRPQLNGLCSPDRDTDEAGAALRSGVATKCRGEAATSPGMAQRVRTHMSTHSIAVTGCRVPPHGRYA